MSNQKAKTESFLLRVQHRERGTLQGTILWGEARRSASFRSGMELLQLLEEATTEEAPPAPWQEAPGPAAKPRRKTR